jgi:2-phospho-L-lactate/phosphoenolpyruvate guanylyltransferase
MPSSPRLSKWTVIVPVKQITLAKTRLSGVDADTRHALAVAFARDTVGAAAASSMVEDVIVVSNDDIASQIAGDVATLIADVPDAGLNPALRYAVSHVRAGKPDASVAAISSDLPALRGDDLTRALRRGPSVPWFVHDADGVGTTMLAAPHGQRWKPLFGPDSRRAHLDAGVVEIDVDGLDRLRRDVDTAADLAAAQLLGVGPATRAVLARLAPRRLA